MDGVRRSEMHPEVDKHQVNWSKEKKSGEVDRDRRHMWTDTFMKKRKTNLHESNYI